MACAGGGGEPMGKHQGRASPGPILTPKAGWAGSPTARRWRQGWDGWPPTVTRSGAAWFPASCSAVALPGAGPMQARFSRVARDAGHQAEDRVWADRTRVPRCRLRAPPAKVTVPHRGTSEPQKVARVSSLRQGLGASGDHTRGGSWLQTSPSSGSLQQEQGPHRRWPSLC